jgi:hypothetical protein
MSFDQVDSTDHRFGGAWNNDSPVAALCSIDFSIATKFCQRPSCSFRAKEMPGNVFPKPFALQTTVVALKSPIAR